MRTSLLLLPCLTFWVWPAMAETVAPVSGWMKSAESRPDVVRVLDRCAGLWVNAVDRHRAVAKLKGEEPKRAVLDLYQKGIVATAIATKFRQQMGADETGALNQSNENVAKYYMLYQSGETTIDGFVLRFKSSLKTTEAELYACGVYLDFIADRAGFAEALK